MVGYSGKMLKMMENCDTCIHYIYDEEYEYYYCDMDLDEDDMARFLMGNMSACAFYQSDDEYRIVRRQM